MFRDAIKGLDKIIDMDIPKGAIILVTGAEGTLKSSLVFGMISGYLEKNNEYGLYATLEQSKVSHLKNMESLGLTTNSHLHLFDYGDMRAEWKENEPDMIKVTEEIIEFYRSKQEKLTVFALDSLNALCSLSNEANLRRSLYYFFSNLRDKGLTSFLIMETPPSGTSVLAYDTGRSEHFLADGVIELGLIEAGEDVKRYIQVKKLRGVNHRLEKNQIVVGDQGISVLGSIYRST
jgi:KaiC/GvpD/RAD55 family RecA-like ATPase